MPREGAPLLDVVRNVLAPGGRSDAAVRCYRVPGRIEVLGKHTDYAGGRSLLCAIERGIWVAARPRSDARIRVIDALRNETAEGDISPALAAPAGHWSAYPFTVARRVAASFPTARRGIDCCFASDLPVAAGMSSSSALVVATFLALSSANDLSADPVYTRNLHTRADVAGFLGAVENGLDFRDLAGGTGVGTFGGSEDHTAILCARPGTLVQYSFAPVRFQRALPVPDGMTFALAASGVAAEKTGEAMAKYNALSRKTAALAEVWRRTTGGTAPTLAAALASSADAAELLRAALRDGTGADGFSASDLMSRLDHFLTESEEIIPAAGEALLAHDLTRFGDLVDRSQAGAEQLLGNQIPETIFLQRAARELGALAASAFGAGFGGSVWALVHERDAPDFLARWERAYHARFPAVASATFFLTRPAHPAEEL